MFGSIEEFPKAQGKERLAHQQGLHALVPCRNRVRAEVHLATAERDGCDALDRFRIVEIDAMEPQGSNAGECDNSGRECADAGCIHWVFGSAQLATEESAVQQDCKRYGH